MFSGFTRSGMVRTALTGLVAILYNESVNYLISRKSYVEAELHHVAILHDVVLAFHTSLALGTGHGD